MANECPDRIVQSENIFHNFHIDGLVCKTKKKQLLNDR